MFELKDLEIEENIAEVTRVWKTAETNSTNMTPCRQWSTHVIRNRDRKASQTTLARLAPGRQESTARQEAARAIQNKSINWHGRILSFLLPTSYFQLVESGLLLWLHLWLHETQLVALRSSNNIDSDVGAHHYY